MRNKVVIGVVAMVFSGTLVFAQAVNWGRGVTEWQDDAASTGDGQASASGASAGGVGQTMAAAVLMPVAGQVQWGGPELGQGVLPIQPEQIIIAGGPSLGQGLSVWEEPKPLPPLNRSEALVKQAGPDFGQTPADKVDPVKKIHAGPQLVSHDDDHAQGPAIEQAVYKRDLSNPKQVVPPSGMGPDTLVMPAEALIDHEPLTVPARPVVKPHASK